MLTREELRERFLYIPSGCQTTEVLDEVRELFFQTALFIVEKTPNCREQSLAMARLEESLGWTLKAIQTKKGPKKRVRNPPV